MVFWVAGLCVCLPALRGAGLESLLELRLDPWAKTPLEGRMTGGALGWRRAGR
jgi:hypothetical protein